MDDTQKDIIRRMRLKGQGYGTIAMQLGVEQQRVENYCHNHGLAGDAELLHLNYPVWCEQNPLPDMLPKAEAAAGGASETVLLRSVQNAILPGTQGGMNMKIAIICLTYMMLLLILREVWIGLYVRRNSRCRYNDCRRCQYYGSCPIQENREE